MGTNMDERQREAAEWFGELERYVKGKNLPRRIKDELEECRELALSGETDWDVISHSVEELLESIVEKTALTAMREKTENEVFQEGISAQLEKMAHRCHTENMISMDNMRKRKNTIVKKTYGQLSEISQTMAHLKELKNEDSYLQFFTHCKVTYEQDVFDMIRNLLQSINGNYAYMTDQMRNMFQNIGGYRNGIGNETFYLEYEGRKDGIDRSVQAVAETADIGGSDIISFGYKTKEVIKGIVKKLMRKRKLLAWMPLLVLLCLLMMGAVVSREQNRHEAESMKMADENDNAIVKDMAQELGKKTVESLTISAIQAVASFCLAFIISLGAMFILVLLVIVLLYICYLKMLKRWCNQQIGKRCGEYLKTELSRFEQKNSLALKVDAVMQSVADEYERLYMEVLNQLFSGMDCGAQDSQKHDMAEWDALCERWNKLKYR